MHNARKAAAKMKGLRVTSFSALLAVSCLLALLLTGYVEPNLGPVKSTENPDKTMKHHSDSPSAMHSEISVSGLPNGSSSTETNVDASGLLQYLSSSVQATTSAIARLEEGQRTTD